MNEALLQQRYRSLTFEEQHVVGLVEDTVGSHLFAIILDVVTSLMRSSAQWEQEGDRYAGSEFLDSRFRNLLASCHPRPDSGGLLTDHRGRIIVGIEPMENPREIDGQQRDYYMYLLGMGRFAVPAWYVEESPTTERPGLGLMWKPKIWDDDKGKRVNHVDDKLKRVVPLVQPCMLSADEQDELCVILAAISWALKLGYTNSGFELREDGSIEVGIKAFGQIVVDDSDRLWQRRHGSNDETNERWHAILARSRSDREFDDEYDGADPEVSPDIFETHDGYGNIRPIAAPDREANKEMARDRYRIGDDIWLAQEQADGSFNCLMEENVVRLPLEVERYSNVGAFKYYVAGRGDQFTPKREPERPQHLRRRIERPNQRGFTVWNSKHFYLGHTVRWEGDEPSPGEPVGWKAKCIRRKDGYHMLVGGPDPSVEDEFLGLIRGAIESGWFQGSLHRRAGVHAVTHVHKCKRCTANNRRLVARGLRPEFKEVHAFNDRGWAHICGRTGEEYWQVKMLCRISVELFPFLDLPEECTHILVCIYGPLVGQYMQEHQVGDAFNGGLAAPKGCTYDPADLPKSEDKEVMHVSRKDPRTAWITHMQRRRDRTGRLFRSGHYNYTDSTKTKVYLVWEGVL